MKPSRWILLVAVILWGVQSLTGCSTIHGVGEDLGTLSSGMAKHHQTPSQIQQDSSRK